MFYVQATPAFHLENIFQIDAMACKRRASIDAVWLSAWEIVARQFSE